MTLWLVRAGSRGEYEKKYLEEKRIYLTWDGLNADLVKVPSRDQMRALLEKTYPSSGKNHITNNLGQIWAFARKIAVGDWIVLPSKLKPAIHVGEVTGEYTYDKKADDPYYHYRTVKWIATDIPRMNFGKDLLYSLGAFMTICQIKRHDAESRIHAMAASGWKPESGKGGKVGPTDPEEGTPDLEELGMDAIATLIQTKFKGHEMARLVDSILKAQGYTTYRSPEGPDKGVDILAGQNPMGFGQPRICVQVKSGDSPLERVVLDQLVGTMQNVQAQHGLLVSWGGFKSSIDKEEANQFFRVRLWDRDDLIEQLLAHYDGLPGALRAELPLKRIWTVAIEDADGDDDGTAEDAEE